MATLKRMKTLSLRAYSILENHGSFLIFPEGISVAGRKLNKIKTGAARIGFGALTNNNWDLDITIVPVGLSYENIIKFKSEVTIKYGSPIQVKENLRKPILKMKFKL